MKRRVFVKRAAAAALGASVLPASALAGASPTRADLVLRRARIFDGTGAAPFAGDVAVTGGRISGVAARITERGAEEIDLAGLALAPGFIDIHTHTDLQLLRDPRADSKVRQGVTTDVTGQDGSSVAWSADGLADAKRRHGDDVDFRDVAGFLRYLDRRGASLNLASMIGAGTVRGLVVGQDDRPASPAELERMVALVQAAVDGGACGVSSGLEYTPGAFADAAELEALVAPLRVAGLPFASHMRNEDDRLLGAMEEVIGIGQRAGVAVQISHLKAQGARNWWKTDDALRLIDDAAAHANTDVMFDVYPYEAYSTGLSNLFPVWAREGGTERFLERLADPAQAPRIEDAVRAKIVSLGSWDAVQMTSASTAAFSWVAGQRLGAAAQARGVEPYALLLEIIRGDRARTGMVGFGMKEENVARKLAHPRSMVCSDGGAQTLGSGVPHPRSYGTFPRVLGRFVRELEALPLETAIAKMTSVPAARLRFTDRGRIAAGLAADLVVFDPDTVADRATFEQPHQYPLGIPHVIVNGTFVVRAGEHTGATPGRAVRPARPG